MTKDDLYATECAKRGSFEFNEAVVGVFPDMLRRSIPGYQASIAAIGSLAGSRVQPGTRCYDLGCSLGAAALAMQRNVSVDGCQILAIDSSQAMISRCRELIDAEPPGGPDIELVLGDIRDTAIHNASLVVMNYTLQFIAPAHRDELMEKIACGLVADGVLVLSEKVVDDDSAVEQMLVDLHHDFKRGNNYSDLEISRKRNAIEDVLVPETTSAHFERLRRAGFRHVGIWLRYFNFVSIVAIR
jgi:tRNA (cmo5U34)-methyltransferase